VDFIEVSNSQFVSTDRVIKNKDMYHDPDLFDRICVGIAYFVLVILLIVAYMLLNQIP
jgi:hypothetical protein